jgi:hypothetical protein
MTRPGVAARRRRLVSGEAAHLTDCIRGVFAGGETLTAKDVARRLGIPTASGNIGAEMTHLFRRGELSREGTRGRSNLYRAPQAAPDHPFRLPNPGDERLIDRLRTSFGREEDFSLGEALRRLSLPATAAASFRRVLRYLEQAGDVERVGDEDDQLRYRCTEPAPPEARAEPLPLRPGAAGRRRLSEALDARVLEVIRDGERLTHREITRRLGQHDKAAAIIRGHLQKMLARHLLVVSQPDPAGPSVAALYARPPRP